MEYSVSIGDFDREKHSRSIEKIAKARTTIEKEPYFKNIARDILSKEGFESITTGPSTSQFQGVPFDFIAMKNGGLCLIELKGSMNTFNYSSEVQFARLYYVVTELREREIQTNIFLLQINLNYSLYQILDSGFYDIIFSRIDKTFGRKRPILPIVDDIMKRMRSKGIRL
ncbi:MAG: hypothetical protein ABIL06_09640 [Pseudomonadota bacterium]